MRKKIVLELETETGFIYDSAGMYVGSSMTMKPFEESKFSTGVPIDDLVKLRNAGFSTDEIIELKRKELL